MKSESQHHERKPQVEITAELIEEFHAYIQTGEALIRGERYREAITHFSNSSELEKLGWQLDFGGRGFLLSELPKPEKYSDIAHGIAKGSTSGEGRMSLSRISFREGNPDLLWELEREIALIYLEEWLHALQEVKGTTLVESSLVEEIKSKVAEPDVEIDIALYLKRVGIEMTPTFLERYNRRIIIEDTSS